MRARYLLIILVILTMISACSKSAEITAPDAPQAPENAGLADLGNFALKVDPNTMEAEVVFDRTASIHYEITSFLQPPACGGAGCLTASLIGWNPATFIATYNVTITNPTNLSVSDIRLVFYNLGGKDIANPDSYTKEYVPTISPFIAFSKGVANRVMPPFGVDTQQVQIYWPPASSFFVFFKVTAWLWINCQDPYEINGMYQNGILKPSSGNANIGCFVPDWQNNVTGVKIDTTPITGGVTNLANIAGNQWQANITNTTGAGPGTYKCLITASSPNPQNYDLYNYLKILISPNGFSPFGKWQLPPGPCTLDFGIVGRNTGGDGIVVMTDPAGACNQVWKYPGGWANAPFMYASLVNLDPTNPNFQPWPVERIDATEDGAFGWTNYNSTMWLQPPYPGPVWNMNTWCNMNNVPSFIWNPEADDHRHYLWWQRQFLLTPVDTCDTFTLDQCALYVDPGFGAAGFHGIPGARHGKDYTDADIVWEAIFPAGLVGREPGQLDPGDVGGIDCWRSPQEGVMFLYVALTANRRVEVFTITDVGPGPVDVVNHFMTIFMFDHEQNWGAPIDCELLPPHEKYNPDPGQPILCVLIDNSNAPPAPPGFGGSVWIYDALTGAFVDRIGDNVNPAVQGIPMYLDTDDPQYSVHIMEQGAVVTQYNYF
jgi:hypothetical protein